MTAPASPAPVWDVINGYAAYQALRTAVDLGVFDVLADGPRAAAEVGAAVGAARDEPVSVLLDTLVALDLLECPDGTAYALTPAAARYLVSASPAAMSALVRYSPGPKSAWTSLAASLRHGAPPPAITAELTGFYPELAEATAPTQAVVAAAVADELARRGLRVPGGTVVDLGCGSGAWLCALLGADDAVSGVGVELPGVLPLAQRRVAAAGLAERVILLAGDYLDVALPAHADVVVLAHVLRAETQERAIALLHKAIRLAEPGGVVVVADYPRPDAGAVDRLAACRQSRQELLLALTVFAATGGTGVTVTALRTWAAAAGAELVAELQPVPRQHVYLIQTKSGTEPT